MSTIVACYMKVIYKSHNVDGVHAKLSCVSWLAAAQRPALGDEYYIYVCNT